MMLGCSRDLVSACDHSPFADGGVYPPSVVLPCGPPLISVVFFFVFFFFSALSPATHRFSVRAGSSGDDGAIAVGMNVKDSSPLVAGHTPRPALDTSDGIRVDAALRPAEEDASLMLFIPVICPARMVQP